MTLCINKGTILSWREGNHLNGQIVNAYGRGNFQRIKSKSPFVQLLEELHGVEGIERIRFTSPHPLPSVATS